jgi:transcriptional regulator with XRE-family HTH domain
MTSEQQSGTELGRFLRARRALVTPAEVGIRASAGQRRTPGLRREELATLAGVSIDYYARLERGTETRPSVSVVDALARALLLNESERQHLHSLVVLAARIVPEPLAVPSRTVPAGTRMLLESIRPNPAALVSLTNDVLAWNPAGLRLLAGIEDWPANRRNYARYLFLHPTARTLLDDWDNALHGCIARLRALTGTAPDTPGLAPLVDELLAKSPEFARLWEHYEVTGHSRERKTFHHPEVGDLALGFQGMEVDGTPGHRVLMFFAEPGTPDHDAVALLDLLAQERTTNTAPGEG